MVMRFERVYNQYRTPEEPPAALRAAAEAQLAYLHPERTHVLSTRDGRAFSRLPLTSNEGWYVTITP
jgi:hypothetical protein